MKTFDVYANGPEITFETINDLKANEIVRKTLFNDDGSIKDIFISENPYTKKNPLNNRFRIGIFENVIYSDGKHAVWKAGSIETDTTDEMAEALDLLNIPHNIW